jgi:3',5'-cyclic AMP phosphodiesterase CpdA
MTLSTIETLILRFRDLVTPQGDTIRRHKELRDREGFVWWGWWNKSWEVVPDAEFKALRQRARSPEKLRIYLFDSGHLHVYEAVCEDIHWDAGGEKTVSPDRDRTPDYYRDQRYFAWFKLTDIRIDALPKGELYKYSYAQVDEFFKTKESRYKPFYGKRVFSEEELKEQDRTIWFVRPAGGQDSSHRVSLLDARTLQPDHFPADFMLGKGSSLLWLSDTHFSLDSHHAFPDESTAQKQNLANRIEQLLGSEKISLGGIVVSGDLTWRAAPEEFGKALACLKHLTRVTGLQSYQLAICPGNHDLEFSKNPAIKDALATELGPASRAAFSDFYEALYYLPPNEHLSSGRRLILRGAVPVEIVCLNTSYLQQHAEMFQGHGFVGERQLDRAADAMGWNNGDETRAVRMLVMHHHLLPTTYREEAAIGARYSTVLDAEAVMRWVSKHRVRLVLHGHQHQPYYARVSRPVDVSTPSGPWHEFYVLGMGSSGVSLDHVGEVGKNTVGVLTFGADALTVKVLGVHPTTPTSEVWCLRIAYTPAKNGEDSAPNH